MDPTLIAVLGLVALFILIGLHVPLGIAMGTVGIVGYALMTKFSTGASLIATELVSNFGSPDLAVVPIFLLMGNLATAGGLSADIYKLAWALVGHRRGGLAMSTVLGNGLFGAICGSSSAAAATFGRVALPEMLKRGYAPHLAAGTVAAGGTLSILVPPSVIMVIYAVMAEEFIVDLFIAAFFPSIILISLYLIAVAIWVRLYPNIAPIGEPMPWAERWKAIRESWAVIVIIGVVVGGIYAGVFTANEAAAFGAVMTLGIAFARRKLTLKVLWESLTGTAFATGMIYVIILGANTITYYFTMSQMPEQVVTYIGKNFSPAMILFLILIVYLILGSIFETISSMLITLPFVLPLIDHIGYSSLWWGIINVVVIEIGTITPPIGMNVFVLHGVARDIPLYTIFRGILPFFYALLIFLTLLCLFPEITLWLPRYFKS